MFPPAEINVSVNRGKKQSSKSALSASTIVGAGTVSGSNSISGPGAGRKRKMNKQNFSATYKDMGRWKPVDDLLLIQGVLQVSDET